VRPVLPRQSAGLRHGADRTMHPVELFGEDWDRMEDRLDKPVREVQQAQSN
jgi:Protein of unknown function (DUF3079).